MQQVKGLQNLQAPGADLILFLFCFKEYWKHTGEKRSHVSRWPDIPLLLVTVQKLTHRSLNLSEICLGAQSVNVNSFLVVFSSVFFSTDNQQHAKNM